MFNKSFDITERISQQNSHLVWESRFTALIFSEALCCICQYFIHCHIFSIPKLFHKRHVVGIRQLSVKGFLPKHEPDLFLCPMFKAANFQTCCFYQRFQCLRITLIDNQQIRRLDAENNRCTLLCSLFLYSSYYFIRLPVCNHLTSLLYLVRYT